jgi:hypothetical protein
MLQVINTVSSKINLCRLHSGDGYSGVSRGLCLPNHLMFCYYMQELRYLLLLYAGVTVFVVPIGVMSMISASYLNNLRHSDLVGQYSLLLDKCYAFHTNCCSVSNTQMLTADYSFYLVKL